MLQNINNAQWQHSKKKAELIEESNILIEIEFNKKVATVKFEKHKYEIRTDGFWCPRITIMKKDTVVATQKQLGLWGTKSEFVVDNQTYGTKTKQGNLFNITYSLNGADILTYKLDASKSKPKITFEIKSIELPEHHLMLLLALGFYSIKNVAVEALANDFMVTAVA